LLRVLSKDRAALSFLAPASLPKLLSIQYVYERVLLFFRLSRSGCKSTIIFRTCKTFEKNFESFFSPALPASSDRCFADGKDMTLFRFLQIFFRFFFRPSVSVLGRNVA
jgi:hypothetical protein